MRKVLVLFLAALLVAALVLALRWTGNLWLLGLALCIFAASLVFYCAATAPRRRAHRLLRRVDEMSGVEFEAFVAGVLKLAGYKNICSTAATGDYGADLVAERGGRRVIFQCKRYAKNCGVQSVQEVCGAKAHYASEVEVVVTNLYFTKNAMVLAEETGVELWDRDVLAALVADGG